MRSEAIAARSLIAVLLAAAACTDDPSGPSVPQAAMLEARAVAAQSATVGQPVGEAPAVVVRSVDGAPLAGVEVRFEVTRGGGTVAAAVDTSGADGIASAGQWTLGPAAGTNEVVARSGSLAPVTFVATAVAPAYTIEVRYMVPVTSRQAQAVDDAIERWESAIYADLTDIPVAVEAGACFTTQPALNETVDDLVIFIEFTDIDGVGRILGQAGPCFIRTGDGLPLVGHLKLDVADLQKMEADGTLDDVVLHEIGHVLGIGSLWGVKNLRSGTGGTDPRFIGAAASNAYAALGGQEPDVPVENTGANGTRDAHWRESIFGSELMTGYIRSTPNPLSALTLASLVDLGYGADTSTATAYALGSLPGLAVAVPLDLGAGERVRGPVYAIDPQGRRIRYE